MSETNEQNESRAQDQARAQVRSVCAMVAALSVDCDRLEELREKAKGGHYVAGWNMPGYMPDSEPAAFETCDEARDYIADAIDESAQALHDEADEAQARGENNLALRDLADNMQQDAQTVRDSIGNPDQDFGATLGRFHYWLTHVPGKLADADEAKELEELEEAAGDCTNEEDARRRIEEDALSVEVRSDWVSPGEEMTAGEFRIVLCTGGPHVELVGDLDDSRQPSRVRVLYRDWGESGELFDFDRDIVLTYCQQFYFGE